MGVCVSLPLPSVHYPGAGDDISDVNELGLDVVHGGGRWWGSAELWKLGEQSQRSALRRKTYSVGRGEYLYYQQVSFQAMRTVRRDLSYATHACKIPEMVDERLWAYQSETGAIKGHCTLGCPAFAPKLRNELSQSVALTPQCAWVRGASRTPMKCIQSLFP